MARYYYEARNKKGRAVTGEMSAVSEEELYQKLKTEGKYLIDARDMQESRSYHQLSPLMLSEFNRELSDMLGAGVPLVRCLTILSQEETRKKKDREILTGVLKAVRQGEDQGCCHISENTGSYVCTDGDLHYELYSATAFRSV